MVFILAVPHFEKIKVSDFRIYVNIICFRIILIRFSLSELICQFGSFHCLLQLLLIEEASSFRFRLLCFNHTVIRVGPLINELLDVLHFSSAITTLVLL